MKSDYELAIYRKRKREKEEGKWWLDINRQTQTNKQGQTKLHKKEKGIRKD